MSDQHPKVVAATIMYGDRWQFLAQVVRAVMSDPLIAHMVIVDNGAKNPGEIREGVREYGDRVTVLETGKNLGSAGGFATALSHVRGLACDYVFLLDDDSVPEEGAVAKFLDILKLFPDQKVVLSGSRHNVLDNKEYFYKPSIADDSPRGTFFEVFSLAKLRHFVGLFLMRGRRYARGPFIPIIPTEGFIYGGAFIPMDAVRNAPLPDKELFLYGDDIEYSWNIKKLGYKSYLCAFPRLTDVDHSFGATGSHVFGQFDPGTAPFKVYYRMRNMVRLSRKHTSQSKFALLMNILVWTLGLCILGFIKYGPTKTYFKRAILLVQAIRGGYDATYPVPKAARLPA